MRLHFGLSCSLISILLLLATPPPPPPFVQLLCTHCKFQGVLVGATAHTAAAVDWDGNSVPQSLAARRLWRWDRTLANACAGRDETAVVVVPRDEVEARRLSVDTLNNVLDVFKRCGVVALTSGATEAIIPRKQLQSFNASLTRLVSRYAAGREALRQEFARQYKQSAECRAPLTASEVQHVVHAATPEVAQVFAQPSGQQLYRERNPGRVDVTLPLEAPFNATRFTFNPLVYPVLAELLGLNVRLKGLHAVVALPGVPDQHWHRDTGLLYEGDDVFMEGTGVHDRDTGVHLPPFAVNMFVPLVPFTSANGPTEFTLGSHMWGTDWAAEEEAAGASGSHLDRQFFVPAGSVILADYRTVHRGRANTGPTTRPMAMLIFGRPWWFDTVNYGGANWGGAATRYGYGSLDNLLADVRSTHASQSDNTKRLFSYLERIWRPGIFEEYDVSCVPGSW